jgi:hypothetical protein
MSTEPQPLTAALENDIRELRGANPGELAARLIERGWTLDAARAVPPLEALTQRAAAVLLHAAKVGCIEDGRARCDPDGPDLTLWHLDAADRLRAALSDQQSKGETNYHKKAGGHSTCLECGLEWPCPSAPKGET